jgi:hypothetical protein
LFGHEGKKKIMGPVVGEWEIKGENRNRVSG